MGNKISKSERLSYITKVLIENPSRIFTLQHFAEILGCSKPTISEDIDVISKNFDAHSEGKIKSLSGAAGGIYYYPVLSLKKIETITEELCQALSDRERIISGGYLYFNDIAYNPFWLDKIAKCLISKVAEIEFDYILTIETKGIPLALTIAQLLNKELIVVRKDARLTEGPTLQMNYVTGSSRSIKTMALPIKSIKRMSKVIFVDDFMKAGGTAKGIIDLLKEVDVEVVAVAVMMTNKEPKKKLVNNYYSLVELGSINEETGEINILPKM